MRYRIIRRASPEVEDEIKFAYAQGTVTVRRLADILSEIEAKKRGISTVDLDAIFDSLHHVYELLFGLLSEVDPVGSSDEDIDTDRDTYSDGSAVSTLIHHRDARPRHVDGAIYFFDIPYFPNISTITDEIGHLEFDSPYPVVEWEVIVQRPPHDRRSHPVRVYNFRHRPT